MNLGIDLDNTLSANPEFYRWMMENWRNEGKGRVFIITGRSPVDLVITKAELKQWGICEDIHYDELFMYPEHYYYSRHIDDGAYLSPIGDKFPKEEIHFRIGAWKARTCQELQVDVMFDDDPVFVSEMRKNGVYVCHVDGKYKP